MATYGHTFTSGDTVTPTKLNNARTVSDIVNADISATAAIAATKLASDSITNTQIKSDAAIAGTKIAPNFGSQNVQTTGNLLIGHTTAVGSYPVEIHKTDPLVGYRWNSANTTGAWLRLQRSRGAVAGTNAIVQNGDGLAQIAFHGDDGANFVEAARITAAVDDTPGTNDMPGRLVFSTTADGASSPTERMRIDSAGNINFGTTAPVDVTSGTEDGGSFSTANNLLSLSRSSSATLRIRRRTSNGEAVTFHRDTTQVGNISVTTTATAYNTSSDYRLKENATPLTGGLALIEQVRPVEFDWKGLNEKGRGFIAHELQAVVPEAVTGEKDAVDAEGNPQYQGVDAAKIVPLLVAAVQELSAKVAALEAAQ